MPDYDGPDTWTEVFDIEDDRAQGLTVDQAKDLFDRRPISSLADHLRANRKHKPLPLPELH